MKIHILREIITSVEDDILLVTAEDLQYLVFGQSILYFGIIFTGFIYNLSIFFISLWIVIN